MRNLAIASLFLASTASPALAANLLLNGGFELDPLASTFAVYGAGSNLGGWTVVGDPSNAVLLLRNDYTEPSNVGTISFAPQAGSYSLDITGGGNTGPTDGIYQDVLTTIGQTYLLSFYLANMDDRASNYTLASSVTVSLNGDTPILFTNSASSLNTLNWAQYSTSFVASASTTRIQFNNATGPADNEAGLDAISLEAVDGAVPEPATWAMMLAGFGMIGFVMRRRRHSIALVS